MSKRFTPIIESILDLDFYKITMGQFAFIHQPDLIVKYAFNNRTTDRRIADYISTEELLDHIEYIKKLRFSEDDILYLAGLGYFKDDYLAYLSSLDLSKANVEVSVENGQFKIFVTGIWSEAIFWETFILSLINTLFIISKFGDNFIHYTESIDHKIDILDKANPSIFCFGTRRRSSYINQANITSVLKDKPYFKGTSNVHLAKKYGIKPVGTNAHELYMIQAGLLFANGEDIKTTNRIVLELWDEMYKGKLSTALTDTFGTKAFLEIYDKSLATLYRSLRHDSGCSFTFGDKVIAHLENLELNPMDYTIIFSDGLDLSLILRLQEHFNSRINISFGWGTNLTNDIGLETLSIVMKAVEITTEVKGKSKTVSLVKLSDNLNKATGEKSMIDFYKAEFGYDNVQSAKLVV